MSIVQTYQGIVRKGRIQLAPPAVLPEGSHVVVLAPDDWQQAELLDPHIARRKANGWLVTYVGSVIAQQPQLQQEEGQLIWQFKVFLTVRGQPLRGPVGFVAVDAYSGEVLTGEDVAAEMIVNASTIARSISSTKS